MHPTLLAAALALASSAAAPPKIAMLPLSHGEGVTEQMAGAVSTALTGELRALNAAQIVTSSELSAVLGVEREKELLGCSTNSCLAELAGALNVDQIITGSLAKIGQSWILQVNRVDAKNGTAVASATRRKKGGDVDDVLDDLPGVAKELFAGMSAQARVAAVTPPTAPTPQPNAKAPRSPLADAPLAGKPDLSKLIVLADGEGRYLATIPFDRDDALFSGDAKALYKQRLHGGGSEGTIAFSKSFWEPRARYPAAASLDFRNGKYTLTCGEKATELKRLSAAETKKFLARAKLYDVRWQRKAYALARDDEGTYFYVDQARQPEDNADFTLYVGNQGQLVGSVPDVLVHDNSGDILRAAGGKLKLSRAGEAEWIAGPGRTRLQHLPVEDNVRLIYLQLGAYQGLPLGTPCDGMF